MTAVANLVDHLDHFQQRVVQDAMADATATYWLRRADTFEWARPRPTDFTGRATPEQIARRDRDLAEMAAACRARAGLTMGRVA